jgi:anti-sigma factor RsiW
MGALPPDQTIAFEDHCITCKTCSAAVKMTRDYIEAMRAAAKSLPPEPPIQ